MAEFFHTPVMPDEVLQFLEPRGSDVIVDATVGGGGHAEKILSLGAFSGTLVGIDADRDALASAQARLLGFGRRVRLLHGNFGQLKHLLASHGLMNIGGLLLDLGVSSRQLDEAARGFSFQHDARLDMRMDAEGTGPDARSLVNEATQAELAAIIRDFGQERAARRIAAGIVKVRARRPIETTGELAAAVEAASGGGRFVQKTLARVFQAIRIAVNGELDNLTRALGDAVSCLMPGGRLVVISYHSLEDGIVKAFLREHARETVPSGHKLVPDTPVRPAFEILTKKPVVPSPAEQRSNPRSRSAKLRAALRRPV